MASTSQLLTWIELECHGWQREGIRGTRALLNEAHKILLTKEAEYNIVFDETTGDFPVVSTVSGTFRYDLPTNCYILKYLLVDAGTVMTDWSTEEVSFCGNDYLRILNIRSYPTRSSTPAYFLFTKDPGDTIDTYKELYYKIPRQILSDSIEHEMPGTTDVEILMPATMLLINSINDHEKMAEAYKYIEQYFKPLVHRELERGEQSISDFCVKRPF